MALKCAVGEENTSTVLKLEKYHGEPEDKCHATLRFTDPNTRERLVGKFKFWLRHKPPQHITQDINERATNPLSKAKSVRVVFEHLKVSFCSLTSCKFRRTTFI